MKSLLFVSTTLLVGLVSVSAHAADEVTRAAQCRASYENAQILRQREQLEAAESALGVCAQTCPPALASDCEKWLAQVAALRPTIRFSARDHGGRLLTDVRVSVDGHVVAAALAGAIVLEPGVHDIRFECPGFKATEVHTAVRAGERDRSIEVTLDELATKREASVASIIVGGLGIAALITAGGLAIAGFVQRDSLRTSCAPNCDPARVDEIRTLWWAAVGFTVGGAAAVGAAAILWPRAKRDVALLPSITFGPRAIALSWTLP